MSQMQTNSSDQSQRETELTNRRESIILDSNGSGIMEIWTFSGRRTLPPSRSATTTSN